MEPSEKVVRVSSETHERLAEIKRAIEPHLPPGIEYSYGALVAEGMMGRAGDELIERVKARYQDHAVEATG